MACTSLCPRDSTLMRRTSPCTRIMGGRPAERWRSDALFLTLKASSWVMSTCPSIDQSDGASLCYACGTIMTVIASQLQAVHARIAAACHAAGRAPAEVALLAVSKTFDAEAVRAAHAAGQIAFGENYVQEAVEKMDALA